MPEVDGDVGQECWMESCRMEPWSRKKAGRSPGELDGGAGWRVVLDTLGRDLGMLEGDMRDGGAELERSDGDMGWDTRWGHGRVEHLQ